MRLNWFSPLPPMASDIGHYSQRILPQLSERSEIRLFADSKGCDLAFLPEVSSSVPAQILNESNFDVFNFGNNVDFHAEAWKLSLVRSGLAVLHDLCYQHFFGMLFLEKLGRPDIYRSLMQAHYGRAGLEAADARIGGDATALDLAEEFPLTAAVAVGACGIVHHYPEDLPERDRLNVPVRSLPLPYASRELDSEKLFTARRQRKVRKIVLFGYLGENRQVRPILRALARSPVKSKIRLEIFGVVSDTLEIPRLIFELGLEGQVGINGFVSEERLDKSLQDSDLALNLRNPSMGEASGSQLRIWDNSLASLVSNHQWYAALPEGTALFVDPGKEEEQLLLHFKRLVEKPEVYWDIGARGKKNLAENHSPGAYVEKLSEVLVEAVSHRPRLALDPVLYGLRSAIFPWWHGVPRSCSLRSTQTLIRSLFGERFAGSIENPT